MSSSYRFKHQGYFLWILLFLWHQPATYCQRGYFPDLRDLSALKPITSSSTCGAEAMDYCQSFRSNSSLQTCSNNTCQFACCSRCGSSKPLPTDLAKFLSSSGVASGEPRNGSSVNSYRFQANSYLQASSLAIVLDYVRTGVTLSVWMKQKAGNRGTIISKDQLSALHYANIFHLIIQDYDLTFHYVPIGRNSSLTVTYTLIQSQSEKLHPDEWHFITVSIIDKGLSYYIDGELMTANSVTLSGSINDPGGIVRIGQSYAGSDQYEGLMQDIFVYTQALTNREVIEAFTGVLPQEYVASHCRCPPTHPKIYPRGPTSAPPRCLRNVDGSLDDAVSRLADTAHPVELATDGDTLGFWLSELTENATIDIELSYSRLQAFYIVLTFYGPLPGAILIERSIDGGKMFQPWQYIAEDCKASFQLENNGQLSEPDDVNCIQYSNPFLATGESITFQTEYPPPPGSNIPVRPFGPGCANLYCSEKLLQFIKATNVRFHFYNHTLVTNAQHRYYGLDRILVAGRCECFGHALTYRNVERTGGQLGRCVCDCHPSTNTEGENCNRCQPLYNNKPFQRGNIVNAFPCIKCECNDHASRCVYNQTLDSQPSSRTLGGGGVCINCQHNTTGRFCELCKERYYRESGKNLTDREVCSPCGCKGPGVQSGKLDCVKDDSNSSVLAGQCDCKVNTMGRQCNICKDGFYNLSRSHPTGCIPCGCILDGTRNRSSSCHTTTGQCDCKDRVTGNTCNTCRTGFYGLTAQDPLGCKECSCDPYGTVAGRVGSCDAVTGDCSCKPGVIGRNCGQCSDGFHSLTQNGCSSCNCSAAGTPQSLVDKCNKDYGNCSCKLNVEGNNCDKCKPGFYNLMQFNPLGCTQCSCDIGGTVEGSGECDQQTGNCTCKRHVIGQQCNQCMLGTFGLNQSDPDGCRPCGCFPNGTVGGKRQSSGELPCFGNNGQCQCLSNVGGRQCDSCIDRHYWNPIGQGCVQCQCDHSVGSIGRNCNDTGHCLCRANIGGRQCDRCIDGYYGLSVNGWCTACNCDPAGSKNVRCLESGLCECKENVEGLKCDQCKSGTVSLQRHNTYGCSGVPSGQPAPLAEVLSPRVILLTWSPPDSPNGLISRYELYRNGTPIYSGLNQAFNDTSLTPDTVYYYYVITFTAGGSTRSLNDGRVYRTFQDAPGGIPVPLITNILPRNVTATWQTPSMPNGRIIEYRLVSTNDRSAAEVVHCRGIIFSCAVGGLRPYTVYNFAVKACTIDGCGRSNFTTILTGSTLPDFQPAPHVTSFPGGTVLFVEWDEPLEPNGRIFRYELYIRGNPYQGDGTRIYESSPAHDSNPLNFRRTNVTGLGPYTVYEFRVRTFTAQVNGDRTSEWTSHRTGEGTPQGENAMNTRAIPINSTAINVSWSPPQTPRGVIVRYLIFKYNATAVKAGEVPGSQMYGVVANLMPYTQYKFTVKACNNYDCTGHSPNAFARTLPAASPMPLPESTPWRSLTR